jgi:hypothetical protein
VVTPAVAATRVAAADSPVVAMAAAVVASAAAMVAEVTVVGATESACLAWVFNLRHETVT